MHPTRSSMSGNRSINSYRSTFEPKSTPRTSPNLRHLTCRQVFQASTTQKCNGRFVLSNSVLYTIILCGRITSIDQCEQHTNYILDDGTASLNGRIWSNGKDGNTDLTGAMLGAYYTVVSIMVTHEGQILLQTLKAEMVLDHNTITMHILTAIHDHCMLQSRRKEDVDRWETAATDTNRAIKNSLQKEIEKEAIVSILSQQAIMDSTTGASARYILDNCQLDMESGRVILHEMIEEGSIYNTVDYGHFKLADNN